MTVIWILCGVVLFPFGVYVTVKTGTYAFFKGRQKFYKKESKHGKS